MSLHGKINANVMENWWSRDKRIVSLVSRTITTSTSQKQFISLALNQSTYDCLIIICHQTHRAFIKSGTRTHNKSSKQRKENQLLGKLFAKVFNYLSKRQYNKLRRVRTSLVKNASRLCSPWIIHSQFLSLATALIYVFPRTLRLLTGPCLLMINNRP